MHKLADIATVQCHFLDNGGRNKGIFFRRGQKNAFQLRVQPPVHIGQLKFIFKIRYRPQSADQDIGALLTGQIDQKASKADNLNIGQLRTDNTGQLNPLIKAETGLFPGAFGYRHYHLIKQAGGPLNQIGMTIGDRVEGTGINGNFVHDRLYQMTLAAFYQPWLPVGKRTITLIFLQALRQARYDEQKCLSSSGMKTKDKILQASLELFNSRGERHVTTNHIAAHLGISPGNLYYHFRNKEDIIHAIFEQYVQVFEDNFRLDEDHRQLGAFGTLRKYLDVVFELMWRFNFFYSSLPELLARDNRLCEKYLQVQQRVQAKVEQLLRWLNDADITRIPESEIPALTDNIKLITVFWLSYYRTQSPGTHITHDKLYRGVLQVLALFKPYLTDSARNQLQQIEQEYRQRAEAEASMAS